MQHLQAQTGRALQGGLQPGLAVHGQVEGKTQVPFTQGTGTKNALRSLYRTQILKRQEFNCKYTNIIQQKNLSLTGIF